MLKLKKIAPEMVFWILLLGLPAGAAIQRYMFDLQLLMLNKSRRDEILGTITATFQDFMTLTFGILVEALPFVILGVLISVLIQTFVSTETLTKRLPKNWFARRIIVSFLGVLMPVCECGNIPVARSLIMRGFSIQESIIFLLAAPSVNIITFIVTWEAFNFNHSVAIVRVIATLIIANLTAFIVVKTINSKKLLTKEFTATCEVNQDAPRTLSHGVDLFRSEMWLITRLLVVGAMIAAATQTFVPRETLTDIGSNVVLSVIAMLALAFVISICSSVDAFFALAYINTFSLGSIMAFLVAGPMVDIKMLALMKTTFTARVLAVISGCVLLFSFILGLVLNYVW